MSPRAGDAGAGGNPGRTPPIPRKSREDGFSGYSRYRVRGITEGVAPRTPRLPGPGIRLRTVAAAGPAGTPSAGVATASKCARGTWNPDRIA